MIYIINISIPSGEHNEYQQVIINKFPIIYINNIIDIFKDKDLVKSICKHIKNKLVFDNSTLYVRLLDNEENMTEYTYKLNEKINIEQWKDSQTVSS